MRKSRHKEVFQVSFEVFLKELYIPSIEFPCRIYIKWEGAQTMND